MKILISAGGSGRRTFHLRPWPKFICNFTEKASLMVAAAVTYSEPRLATFWHYAKVELVPPTPGEIPTAIQNMKKIIHSAKAGGFKHLTVKEAVLNGLVATEVWMWFYIGEILGKRGVVGYDV
ncbi:ATP synthase subunit g, mitochondrial-like [Rattus norvegicus]|uniref:ATP synthase subunit g, mitochondrial-like n=1 Tax=Rattus norvegicus TaxID=10116 RepID=UPI00001D0101|nr:ATP synthase subunit g, mitochondrial-like [Rattus norvegicus]